MALDVFPAFHLLPRHSHTRHWRLLRVLLCNSIVEAVVIWWSAEEADMVDEKAVLSVYSTNMKRKEVFSDKCVQNKIHKNNRVPNPKRRIKNKHNTTGMQLLVYRIHQ
jgi:hypothetical protein